MAYNIVASGTTANLINLEELKASVNGNLHKLAYINSNALKSNITLPTAPTIYPHDTVLTPEQIASGVINHADASNSGLIVNGKFNTDTSWTKEPAWSISSGKAILNGSLTGNIKQSITCPIGKVMIAEFDVLDYTPTAIIEFKYNNVTISTPRANGRYSVEFTSVGTAEFRIFGQFANASIDNISVYPADAISRSDLVFLESWHEDISEKNFVYPLGNVQYLGANTDGLTGIVNGSFTGFETYSLFGNWQTPSTLIGKGYVWSSLTEAQKRAFVANPENNCYLDGDKVIQVRYRVRVVQGWGDVWYNVSDTYYDASIKRHYGSLNYQISNGRVKPKGRNVISSDLDVPSTNYYNVPSITTTMLGHFIATDGASGYEGKCFALPIALASRRNQGMYHNVYNPNGTKLASDGLDCFTTTISFNSISDCFDPAKLLTASGYIGTVSGRPDGLFYDQAHGGDIQDLRNSSKKVEDYNRLISKEFNKLVAGTYRGKEGEWEVLTKTDVTLTYGNYDSANNNYRYFIQPQRVFPTLPLSTYITGKFIMVIKSGTYIGKIITSERIFSDTNYFVIEAYPSPIRFTDGTIVPILTGVSVDIIFARPTTRIKSNTLLHCDIIGNPTNYPTAWKESGVFGTPLIVAEDGTSLLPDGVLAKFKLSRKANAAPLLCLRSTDNGATWTSFTPTFTIAANAITLTDEPAANLVMIYYQTHTSMAAPVVNSEVLEVGDIYGTKSVGTIYGAALAQSLIYKFGDIGAVEPTNITDSNLYNYLIDASTGNKLVPNSSYYMPTHNVLSLGKHNTPAVKVFPYLTRANGKAYLNLVFKEMKYGSYLAPTTVTAASATYTQNLTYKINIAGCALDGKVIKWTGNTTTSAIDWSLYDVSPSGVIYLLSTGVVYTNAKLYDGDSWGDDSKFNIVDYVSTTLDDNGQIVLIGQKTVELTYFIDAGE